MTSGGIQSNSLFFFFFLLITAFAVFNAVFEIPFSNILSETVFEHPVHVLSRRLDGGLFVLRERAIHRNYVARKIIFYYSVVNNRFFFLSGFYVSRDVFVFFFRLTLNF